MGARKKNIGGDTMEENDISNVINKFSDILKEKDIKLEDYIDNNIKNENNDKNDSEKNGINIDINTILKFKKIADNLNNSKNPRSSLLQALKPFLSSEKQKKIDEYIKIVNILSILDILNNDSIQ